MDPSTTIPLLFVPPDSTLRDELSPTSSLTPTEPPSPGETISSSNSRRSRSSIPLPQALQHHPSQAPSSLRAAWLLLALPLLSLSYLAFCYVVQYNTVRVSIWHVEDPVSRMSVIKAGVTSVSIVIIATALLPLKTLIGDLQGEEFFRILSLNKHGLPLSAVNQVSTPSWGLTDQLSAILRRRSSGISAGAFVAGLVAIVASTLAPAALSVRVVQVDDTIKALRVGALPPNSVWSSTEEHAEVIYNIKRRADFAAFMPWVEAILQSNYKWKLPEIGIGGVVYSIPSPLDVSMSIPIRYLTDVIKIRPKCEWHTPTPLQSDDVWKDLGRFTAWFTVPGLNKRIRLDDMDISLEPVSFELHDPIEDLKDLTYNKTNIDGSSTWHLIKCIPTPRSPCTSYANLPDSYGNLIMDGIPSVTYTSPSGRTFGISFLSCRPNETIETREVWIDLEGKVELAPLQGEGVYKRQGNLNELQTRILMSQVLQGFRTIENSGPNVHRSSYMEGLGGGAQIQLLFSQERSLVIPQDGRYEVKPIEEITRSYGRALQSTLKLFVDGTLLHYYVPSRTNRLILIFVSSFPHLVASTVVFVALSIFVIVVHFRKPVPQFTLFAVASSLSGSELPSTLEDVRQGEGAPLIERFALEELQVSSVKVDRGSPGSPSSRIQLHQKPAGGAISS
ncbi:hypothetical protein FRC03_011637 [Tulasnella sp. 419]|nr:hypothetical protein FRC03_011637 [Tulasnella sp. 419]